MTVAFETISKDHRINDKKRTAKKKSLLLLTCL